MAKGKILAPVFSNQDVQYWYPEKKVFVPFTRFLHKEDEMSICDMAYEEIEDAKAHFWISDYGNLSEIREITVIEFLNQVHKQGAYKANPFTSINFMKFIKDWFMVHRVWVTNYLEERKTS